MTKLYKKRVSTIEATSKGRQFDRIFGVWLGGVEVLRSCTAEPRATGIVWTVEKDITRYSSLLKTPNEFAVYIGNIVDSTYTGVYHVNLTLHFYPSNGDDHHDDKHKFSGSSNDFNGSPADLIVPVSRNLPLNGGQWFLVENSTDVQLKEFEIPRNAYRAVLEVYVSYHENDEFWYGNPPNDYIVGNNLTTTPGNGPFREVLVSLDGVVVGAVWPFTVVYTGGINPLLWRPITAIGSFDLPTYDIEITPFLGNLLDGKQHSIGFGVTNALNVWYIDANLHVWLDAKSEATEGALTDYKSPPPTFSLSSNFKGLNGTFFTGATRSISSSGWVKSSHGKITTNSYQDFSFINSMEIGKNGDLQVVNQNINANSSVYAMLPSSYLYSIQKARSFPMYLHTDSMDQGSGSFSLVANVSLGFNEESSVGSRQGFSISSLNSLQNGQGSMIVNGNLVTSGLGSTQQRNHLSRFTCTDVNAGLTVETDIHLNDIVQAKWLSFGIGKMPLFCSSAMDLRGRCDERRRQGRWTRGSEGRRVGGERGSRDGGARGGEDGVGEEGRRKDARDGGEATSRRGGGDTAARTPAGTVEERGTAINDTARGRWRRTWARTATREAGRRAERRGTRARTVGSRRSR
ncbi:hypothetical protein Scep_011659 [Stephania cephalantha]|uniref:Peptide N-acetyl-beta-D-glucosaminyl asparaginase amidase A N-terminal domain-containing protein n=1 Tax=Stephania cephalantha TaxID=152367 RepID=A0AAP0P952_9MAGN